MKARPILFSGPMVHALIEGRKTQTRRAVKPQPVWVADPGVPFKTADADPEGVIRCPYGTPGDLLWVRETHYVESPSHILYGVDDQLGDYPVGRWDSPIHMPRWASRLTLRITDVRVERLQDISEADAVAEGVDWRTCPTRQTDASFNAQQMARRIGMAANYEAKILYVDGYKALWESIKGPNSWDANPWVWAISFEVIRQNVDEVISAEVAP